MKIHANLSEFNKVFAAALADAFNPQLTAMQSEDGTLLFRGPIPNSTDAAHVGTHVAVSLEPQVHAALDEADESDRAEMTENLVQSLGAQIRATYDPNNIGEFALDIVGNMRHLRG